MERLGIYIHIPFCLKKCKYCDFFSYAATDDVKLRYTEALIQEIKGYGAVINAKKSVFSDESEFPERVAEKEEKGFIGRLLGRGLSKNTSNYEVATIYIGGGTPSVMPGSSIKRILDAVCDTFHVDRTAPGLEITLEANPATVTHEKLSEYLAAGVNRISVGLQSANDEELALLGRLHTYEDLLERYDMVRKAGFDNVNIDSISALPGQTINNYKNTLFRVLDLEPEHISSYSLIIEPGTPFHTLYGRNGRLVHELPDEDTERKMYNLTVDTFAKAGYERYEISNFALPGKFSRHNTSYWRRAPYLGFGAGASSFLENTRWKNTTDMRMYLALTPRDIPRIRTEIEPVSKEDAMAETVYLGMRETRGISIKEFRKNFGTDIHTVYGPQISRHVRNKTMVEDGDRLYLTERGLEVSNFVFSDFMP